MKKLFPNTILQAIGLIILGTILSTPLYFLTENKNINLSEDIKNTISYIVVFLMVIALTYFINRYRKIALNYDFKVSNLLPMPLLMGCVFLFEIGFGVPLSKLLTSHFGTGALAANPFDRMTFLIGSLILGPVLEEIVFRGIILKGLLATHSSKFAIIASSILFAIAHGKPIQMIGALVIGLFLGWIYDKTKSLGTTILLHFTANFSSQLALFINYKYGNLSKTDAHLYGDFSYPIIVVFLMLFGLSFYYITKKTKLISL